MRLFTLLTALTMPCLCQAQITAQQQTNLAAFTRLYGYIRYFHPSDEAASVNWNQFAIYGTHEVFAAANETELEEKLKNIFQPLAPAAVIYNFQLNKNRKPEPAGFTPPVTDDYKPVFWQHQGMGGNANSIYKSVRYNRPLSFSGQSSWMPFSQSLDATPFRGKEVKLRAWMKMEQYEGSGSGYMWLRVDKKTGSGFFYNMNDRPVITPEWTQYEFTGKIDADAERLVFGGYLQAPGKFYIDNIELLVNDNGNWNPVAIANPSFETSNDDKNPTGWFSNSIKSEKSENAENQMIRLFVSGKDAKEGTHCLALISYESDPERKKETIVTRTLFKAKPGPGECIEKQLSPSLKAIIPIVLWGTETATYPAGNAAQLQQLKADMKAFASSTNMKAGNLYVRLADIVIAWNIFKHFFPYWEDAAATPDNMLTAAFEKAVLDTNPFEFKRTLQQMTEKLNDGHISVSIPGDSSRMYSPALLPALAENRVVVDRLIDTSLRTQLQPGDIIETIDGEDALALLKKSESLVSGSPQWKESTATPYLLAGKKNEAVQLRIRHNNQSFPVTLQRNTLSYLPIRERNKRMPSGFIQPAIGYIDLDKVPGDSIKSLLTRFSDCKAIICDLRGYPNNNHQLISYLMNEKENTEWMFVPQLIYPDMEKVTYSGSGWNVSPLHPHVKAKVIFITDGRAISYAESYMGFIKDFHLATIVGGPTAGTNGNVNPFTLPGGYTISWTGMLVKNHDGSKHHLKGIEPDVPVNRTINGIREGKDELLEKALEIASQ